MAVVIPRGIRVIDWKTPTNQNPSDTECAWSAARSSSIARSKSLSARSCSWMTPRPPEGRLLIAQGKDRASRMVSEIERLAAELLLEGRCALRQAIDSYIKAYIKPGLDSEVDKERQTAKAARARLRHCASVKIPCYEPGFSVPTGPLAALSEFARGRSEKALGDFHIDELTEQDTTEYINARLREGLAKSTVKREVYALQSVVNKLHYTDNKAWKRLDGHNPFEQADKAKLKGGERLRRRVISADEGEALLAEQRRCRNPEMPMIFALALSTGMRRAELLGLRWEQVDLERGVIHMDADQTKAGEDRLVILLPEAKEAFKAIPRVDERVFHYKIEGYKTNFRRVLERAGLSGIHMHDTRRSFISRVLKNITSSPVAIADMVGARSVSNLKQRTIDRIRQNDMIEAGAVRTEEELRWTVHHKDGQTTARYANLAPEKSRKQ